MDVPGLDADARRLALAASLTRRLSGSLPEGRPPKECTEEELAALAKGLASVAIELQRAEGITFSPAYPGATAGVEAVSGGLRIVLATRARDVKDELIGVVFTTLITGRAPQVSVAPPHTRLLP